MQQSIHKSQMCLDTHIQKFNNLCCRQRVIKCSAAHTVTGNKDFGLILTTDVGPAEHEPNSARLPVLTGARRTHRPQRWGRSLHKANKAGARKTRAILLWAIKLKSKE